jgi:hypothetical protein
MNAAVAEDVGEETAAKPKKAKAVVETVTMDDGRVVEFVGKRRMNKRYVLDSEGNLDYIQLDFKNGTTRKITLPQSLLGRFAGHGAIQKYGDELAGLKGEDGGEPDIDDMVLTIDELDTTIQKGEWSERREGDGLSGTSVLIKALVAYGGKSVEQIKAFLKDKDAKFKMALRLKDDRPNKDGKTIAYYVKAIEAEKVAKATKVDTNSELDQLDAMG